MLIFIFISVSVSVSVSVSNGVYLVTIELTICPECKVKME